MDSHQPGHSIPARDWLGNTGLSWSLLGVKRGAGGAWLGLGALPAWWFGRSTTALSQADLPWFNATVPVSRMWGGSSDEKLFAVTQSGFPFSPSHTLC